MFKLGGHVAKGVDNAVAFNCTNHQPVEFEMPTLGSRRF